MKFLYTLFAMAVIAFSPVHASDHEVLVTENDMGGHIILTSYTCPMVQMSESFVAVTTSTDFVVYGCWFLYDNQIFVAWVTPEGLHRAQYDPELFRPEKVL
jgi:hypothetical protein